MNGDLLFPSDLSPLSAGWRSWQGCGWGGRIQGGRKQWGHLRWRGWTRAVWPLGARDRLEISHRSSTSGADCCYFGCSPEASCILMQSWGAVIHFPALPVPHLGGWGGRTVPGHACALCQHQGLSMGVCQTLVPALGPCSITEPTGRATALTFAFFPLPQQLQTEL